MKMNDSHFAVGRSQDCCRFLATSQFHMGEVGGVMNDVSSIEETLNKRSCNFIIGTMMHLHNPVPSATK